MRISDWSSDVCSSDLDRPDQIMAEARDQQLGHTKVDIRIHFPAVIPRFVAPAATGRHDVSSACTSLYTKRRDRLAPRLPGRIHAQDGAGGNPEQIGRANV